MRPDLFDKRYSELGDFEVILRRSARRPIRKFS